MNIDVHVPGESLKPFIKSYLIIESQHEIVNRVLPGTSLVMAFRYKGKVSYLKNGTKEILPSSVVSGLRKSGRLINYSGDSGNILVTFRETAAHAFINEPLFDLFEDSVSLDSLSGYGDAATIENQLAEAVNNAQRIQLIEQYLLSKLYSQKSDLLISAAIEKIRSANGLIKIRDLSNALCISLDAFEKRFRRIAGVSPKQFSYIIRVKSVIGNRLQAHSLADTALKAGYFDQSHFNKDFKLFTGQTPMEFLKAPVFW